MPTKSSDSSSPLRPHPLLTQYHSSEAERRSQVDRWFDSSASSYDFITQVMSFGSGHRYRRQALLRAGLSRGMSLIDVACGTGVLTAHARDIVGSGGLVLGVDPSRGMLREAQARGAGALIRGLAEALPFKEGAFDFLSMGYALRHVADLRATFREYRRVLKPKGRLLILEITPPRSKLAYRFLSLYLGRVVPALASLGRGGPSAAELMRYYWDTIETCVAPEVILGALHEASFSGIGRQVEMGILSTYTASR